MNQFQFVILFIAVLLLSTGPAYSQKKPVRKAPTKKTAPTKTVIPPLDVRVAREKVGNQLAHLNNFLNVLGPIAQAIETLDKSATTKKLPKATIDQNELNKQKVVTAIRNMKVPLSALEAEFRVKISLQKYLANIRGITDLAAESEDSALAGKFVASKEPLRDIAQKLTDTLAALPR